MAFYKMISNLEFSHALLDFDGTLANTLPVLYQAFQDFLRKYNITPTREKFDSLNGPSLLEICQTLKRDHQLTPDPETLLAQYKMIIDQKYHHANPLEGADLFLQTLMTHKVSIHMVTSNTKDHIEPLLEKFGWKSIFTSFTYGNEVETSKPDPAIYELSWKKTKSSTKKNVFVVEDSAHGVCASHHAGFITFAIAGLSQHPILLEAGAEKTFTNFDTLMDYLLKVS
ncbi:MAG: HAD family phosphatase [Deltaproteobacteria bacterium]|nr:HAD family phosphatase [Deltaproteobacteria bacterium]